METQESIIQKPSIPILMVGLDDAGKTTLLYNLMLGGKANVQIIPTIGYNVETVEYNNKNYTIWDIGGLDTVRVLWKFYADKKAAVVFVVDASNPARLKEAKVFLHAIMAHEDLNHAVLLLVSNKHDKANCLSNDELEKKLFLESVKQSVRIVNTSAFKKESLHNVMCHLEDINAF